MINHHPKNNFVYNIKVKNILNFQVVIPTGERVLYPARNGEISSVLNGQVTFSG
jgi:hypothetical protein